MKQNGIYSSTINLIIRDWLTQMSPSLKLEQPEETQQAIEEAYRTLGYDQPFDREQRAINDMLTEANAGKISCLVAWGYYHDFKVISARNKAPALRAAA